MDVMVQLIGSLGFPIAIAVYLIYYNNKLNEMHKEEMDTLNSQSIIYQGIFQSVLVNNTLAIQRLTDIITGGGNNEEV